MEELDKVPTGSLVVFSAHGVSPQVRAEAAHRNLPDPSNITYLTQTALAVDETRATIAALKERFPQARGRGSEDICYETTNCQHALQAVTGQADPVLVLGSENSSNSVRLLEQAHKAGTPAHLIEDASYSRPARLRDVATIGLSAGASDPPALVRQTLSALAGLGPLTVQERITTTEDTYFAPPAAVRKDRSVPLVSPPKAQASSSACSNGSPNSSTGMSEPSGLPTSPSPSPFPQSYAVITDGRRSPPLPWSVDRRGRRDDLSPHAVRPCFVRKRGQASGEHARTSTEPKGTHPPSSPAPGRPAGPVNPTSTQKP
ncbi:hypothetical protein [Streptomyces sp. NPDC051662]|uniref:hypothetical protein n=1 Tax=Streptomyces sp. NPDC051662 TaxID=3154750 RepID=UPI00344727BF